MDANGDSKRKRFAKWKKVPGRVLRGVRDAYIHGISSCARGQPLTATVGYPPPDQVYFPEAYNGAAHPSHDEEKEVSSCGVDRYEVGELKRESTSPPEEVDLPTPMSLRRKCRRMAVVGRIDECKACEFRGADDIEVGSSLLRPNYLTDLAEILG